MIVGFPSRVTVMVAAVFSCCGGAAAQVSTTDAVVVTATRTPARVADVVAEVTVLDRAAIERAAGRTLAELLSQQAGLQMSSNGGPGKTASVFIRGLESRHTLLLLDGVPVTSATVGSPSLDNLPLELIERIEIVRGPMTALYGNGAMGGVVQLFTRRASQGSNAQARVAIGSDRYGAMAAGVSHGGGGFDVVAGAQRQTTRGFSATNSLVPFGSHNPDDDGFAQSAGNLKLGFAFAPGWRIEALALASRGLTRIDDGPGADAQAQLRNDVQRLALSGPVAPAWRSTLTAAASRDVYDTKVSASAFTPLGATETKQRSITWDNDLDTPIGRALLLLEQRTQDVSRPGAPYAVSKRDIQALALGLAGSAGAHDWQASLRRDRNSQFGGVSTGALGYGFALGPQWRLLASAGTSHTLPSFNQLYFPGFGNPLLLPEEGRHVEAGVQWSASGQRLRAAWYQHRYRGFISSGPQPANLPYAEIDGVTLSWQGSWSQLNAEASIDQVDPRNATSGSANNGKRLPRRAERAARLSLQWQPGAWALGLQAQVFSHRFDDAANATRLGGYALADLDFRWPLTRQLSLLAKLNNLGDKRYQTALGYNQPGREAQLALRWALR